MRCAIGDRAAVAWRFHPRGSSGSERPRAGDREATVAGAAVSGGNTRWLVQWKRSEGAISKKDLTVALGEVVRYAIIGAWPRFNGGL